MTKQQQNSYRVSEVLKELNKGTTRPKLLQLFGKKWHISTHSVDRLIKIAKEQQANAIEKANQKAEEAMASAIQDAAVIGLKSALEVDMKLQEIIFNDYRLIEVLSEYKKMLQPNGRKAITPVKKVIRVENTTADRLRAMDIYYKRNKFYGEDAAPTNPQANHNFSDDQFNKILNLAQREIKTNSGQ